ncbi:MAG: NAD(P)H-hydrate dehydratase [Myxococcota bacterium]
MQQEKLSTQGRGIWSVQQLRAVEQAAVAAGIDEFQLVQRAAKAACCALQCMHPKVARVAILCGVGNNGADGYALAAQLKQAGQNPQLYPVWGGPKTDAAQQALTLCKQLSIPQNEAGVLPRKSDADVLVDGLLGVGLSRPLQGQMLEHIQQVNQLQLPVLALDIPSGLHADSGSMFPEAVRAHGTISFLGLKRGFFMGHGLGVTGRLMLHNLDVDAVLFPDPEATVFHGKHLQQPLCRRRTASAHKGCFGRCLVVAGTQGMPGAGVLATHAALRTGAGLVCVATHPQHAAAGAMKHPEALWHGVRDAKQLNDLLSNATCVVVGPGLGQETWGKQLWESVSQHKGIPLVVDADALGLLAKRPSHSKQWILTPHPKEAAQLLGCNTQDIQRDRFTAAHTLQARYGGVVVLKGACTVVASEKGMLQVCTAGNPGMASAGMGDVLAGILGGLLAQFFGKVPLQHVAALGVWLHAQAGDKVALQQGQRGLLARDVIACLQPLVNPLH